MKAAAPLTKAYLSAVLYALIIGFSFIFVKTALVSTGPFDLLAHRFTISLAALLVFLALSKTRLNIRKRDYLAILPMAVLYPVLFLLSRPSAWYRRRLPRRESFKPQPPFSP